MKFPTPLIPATLLQRYKRFLFDARLGDGTVITGSCANTGSMIGLTAAGTPIWINRHDPTVRRTKVGTGRSAIPSQERRSGAFRWQFGLTWDACDIGF